MKIFLENGTSLEWKYDSFYINTPNELSIHINEKGDTSESSTKFFVENGDSFKVHLNHLYITSKLSAVFVNDRNRFSIFPSHISHSFRDFCSHAYQVKQDTILGKEFTIARFDLLNLKFEIISPSTQKGTYTFLFKEWEKNTYTSNEDKIDLFNKLKSLNFDADYSDKKKTLMIKAKRFEQNAVYDVLLKISSFQKDKITETFSA